MTLGSAEAQPRRGQPAAADARCRSGARSAAPPGMLAPRGSAPPAHLNQIQQSGSVKLASRSVSLRPNSDSFYITSFLLTAHHSPFLSFFFFFESTQCIVGSFKTAA